MLKRKRGLVIFLDITRGIDRQFWTLYQISPRQAAAMVNANSLAVGLALGTLQAAAVNFAVPAQFNASGYTFTALDPAPVALS